MINVGVLLSGCGFYDGTEVAEAVLSALSLERAGARAVYIAPEVPQMHTVDHLTGSEVEGELRNVASESARLARGKLKSLDEIAGVHLAALIIPGGHGAVKNLMTNFAVLGERREGLPGVRDLMASLAQRRAPIGSISLGRAVVQAFLDEPLSQDDMQLPATEILVDEERRLVFTPGFLTGASLLEVAMGIEKMVAAVLSMGASRLAIVR